MVALGTESRLRVHTVESEDELLDLRGIWNQLNYSCSEANIFTTWEWITAVGKHASKGCRMLVISVEDGPDLVGIAPLVIDRSWPLRVVRFMGAGPLNGCYSDYCSFIIAHGREEVTLKLILNELLNRSRDWDVLDLREVPSQSCLMFSWLDQIDQKGYFFCAERHNISYPIPLPEAWQTYLEGLSPNTRSAIERKTRKIAREHKVRFERVEDPSQLDASLDTLFALHTDRWESRGLAGLFGTQNVREFHRDVASRFLEKDWLDLNVMYADDEAVGAIYNFVYRDTVYYYASGFRSAKEWSNYSLGSILLGHSIKSAIEKGFKTFDLLRGDGEYKLRFGPREVDNYRLQIARTRSVHTIYAGSRKLHRAAAVLRRFTKKRPTSENIRSRSESAPDRS